MPIQLSAPLEKEFELVRTDEDFGKKGDTPTTVLIRQAKQGEHERRSSLFAKIVREHAINTEEQEMVRFIQQWSMEELKRLEVFLTLKSCNIKKPDGKLLWEFDKNGQITEQKFNEGWASLPVSVAREIHECVLDVNVAWMPLLGEEI
jgi:hypothetical protein